MKNQIVLKREVGHGGIVPPGWQMAWYEPRRRVGVYFPRPLHWIVRVARELIYRARIAWHAPRIERKEFFDMQRTHRERQRLAEEYARGYLIGWRECFQSCLEVVEDEIRQANDSLDVSGWLPVEPSSRREN
jgi:hypothetical protein